MWNYLVAEWFQYRKRLSFWILLSSAFIVPIIIFISSFFFPEVRQSSAINLIQGFREILSLDLLILMLTSYYAFHQDYTNRTLIHPASFGLSRLKIYFAKYLSALSLFILWTLLAISGFLLVAIFLAQPTLAQCSYLFTAYFLPSFPIWLMQVACVTAVLFAIRSNFGVPALMVAWFVFPGILNIALPRNIASKVLPYLFTELKPGFELLDDSLKNPDFLESMRPLLDWNGWNPTPLIALLYAVAFTLLGYSCFKRYELD